MQVVVFRNTSALHSVCTWKEAMLKLQANEFSKVTQIDLFWFCQVSLISYLVLQTEVLRHKKWKPWLKVQELECRFQARKENLRATAKEKWRFIFQTWFFLFYRKGQFRGSQWIPEFSFSNWKCTTAKPNWTSVSGHCMNDQSKGKWDEEIGSPFSWQCCLSLSS